MDKRHWGEKTDQVAAQQLSLSVDHTIFMMSSEVELIEDIDEVSDEFRDAGYVSADEVLSAVNERIKHIKLPAGFALVGMAPLCQAGPMTYGIVDLSSLGRA